MNLRVFNQKFLEPISMWLMIGGIVFLCQPWIEVLHAYSVTIMLIGLIGFNVAAHIAPPEQKLDGDETGPQTARSGGGHG